MAPTTRAQRKKDGDSPPPSNVSLNKSPLQLAKKNSKAVTKGKSQGGVKKKTPKSKANTKGESHSAAKKNAQKAKQMQVVDDDRVTEKIAEAGPSFPRSPGGRNVRFEEDHSEPGPLHNVDVAQPQASSRHSRLHPRSHISGNRARSRSISRSRRAQSGLPRPRNPIDDPELFERPDGLPNYDESEEEESILTGYEMPPTRTFMGVRTPSSNSTPGAGTTSHSAGSHRSSTHPSQQASSIHGPRQTASRRTSSRSSQQSRRNYAEEPRRAEEQRRAQNDADSLPDYEYYEERDAQLRQDEQLGFIQRPQIDLPSQSPRPSSSRSEIFDTPEYPAYMQRGRKTSSARPSHAALVNHGFRSTSRYRPISIDMSRRSRHRRDISPTYVRRRSTQSTSSGDESSESDDYSTRIVFTLSLQTEILEEAERSLLSHGIYGVLERVEGTINTHRFRTGEGIDHWIQEVRNRN